MQVAYTQEEMVGITELSRGLNSFVEKVKNRTIEKLAIMKNNKPEVIVIPTDEYERMKQALDYQEHLKITQIVEERLAPDAKFISEDELLTGLRKANIDV